MEKYNKIWQEIKEDLRNDLEEMVYAEIFEPVDTVFKVVNNYIYIIAPSDFIKKRIEMLYLNKLRIMVLMLTETKFITILWINLVI